MKTFLKSHLEQALAKAGMSFLPEDIYFEIPKNQDHGDLSTNVAFTLAKRAKANPRAVAQQILDLLSIPEELVEKPEIAGPGFINFKFKPAYFISEVGALLKTGSTYGRHEVGKGQRVMVEFVSANPTGPLTIGHGRQAVLGDTIANLMEWLGYEVVREYYFNNAGRQMRVLGDSVRLRYLEEFGEKIEFPQDYYQGEYIRDIAREMIKEHGDSLRGSDDVIPFKDKAEAVIFEDIKNSCRRLGINHDVYYNENSLYENGHVDESLALLREKGVTYDKDGAVWFKTTDFGNEQDKVLVKSTGEPTYRLPDIAYHIQKFKRGFDKVVDIFGSDHIATYPDVLLALKILGYDPAMITVLIHQFVTVTQAGEIVKMSTRKANFITLDWLTDEAGADVVRFFFLMRSMGAHLNFDLDLAKKETDENPVFYLQYAHARIASIVRKAEDAAELKYSDSVDLSPLGNADELDLIRLLLQFPETVLLTATHYEPHRLIVYLNEVATQFHKFYHSNYVIGVGKELGNARLALCVATKTVLKNGFDILGISAPERM
ncbi:MAG: arginine--tRNA ligase [Bacteroidetes bacterium]|nr:arginine--tRNA ligase [Bacteroidota bacterium]